MNNSKKLFYSLIILAVCVSFLACNNENAFDCVKSSGPVVVQERKVAPFKHIIVEANIDLSLSTHSTQSATVQAGKNVINNINLKNTGDTLWITNSNTCNWVRNGQPITVSLDVQQEKLSIVHQGYGKITSVDSLHIPDLSVYSLDAGGNINIKVVASSMIIYSNSHALIEIAGKTNTAHMWINKGIGRICAERLNVNVCTVINGGSNEIRTFPIDLLEVEIRENGNIIYYNEPAQIKSMIKGSGRLIKRP